MDTQAFCHILRLKPFWSTVTDANVAPNSSMLRLDVLDLHTPLRTTGQRRCSKHNNDCLSEEARQAKQLHRWLQHRYRRIGLPSDKQSIFLLVCLLVTASSGYVLITSSPNSTKYRKTLALPGEWHRLLHSKHKTVYDGADCVQLVSVFHQFFAKKVNRQHFRHQLAAYWLSDLTTEQNCHCFSQW